MMNNSLFGKTMENTKKHKDIKLVATGERTNYLVLEPNFYIIQQNVSLKIYLHGNEDNTDTHE